MTLSERLRSRACGGGSDLDYQAADRIDDLERQVASAAAIIADMSASLHPGIPLPVLSANYGFAKESSNPPDSA